MKPVILYVDDEPHNLTVFESTFPDDWKVYTFDNPAKALEEIDKIKPWVVVSDQRMPGITGAQFLEITRKIVPNAVRIIVTGYSDEALVVESVRKARVFDYIKKPWNPEELEASVKRAIEVFQAAEQARQFQEELKIRAEELRVQKEELLRAKLEIETSQKKEIEMRQELQCWVPPFVRWAVINKIQFPIKKDLVGITFDVIKSSELLEANVNGRPVRSLIIQLFSEILIRHGGWRESHSGDSAYGHFGLMSDKENPCEAALAVAREFRVALRGVRTVNNVAIECGIALHRAKDCIVDIHNAQIVTPEGVIVQKSFDTTSKDVNILHRMEKLVHDLPGTNIIMTKDFIDNLRAAPDNIVGLGSFQFPDHPTPLDLYLFKGDKVTSADLDALKSNLAIPRPAPLKSAS